MTSDCAQAARQHEVYRLADPFLCLVCGGHVPAGVHICCHRSTWEDRFTYTPTSAEKSERIAQVAEFMGLTYQGAEREIASLDRQLGDYGDVAETFLRALVSFRGFRAGEHSPVCADCKRLADGNAVSHPMDLFWWDVAADRCLLARLHLAKVHLALCEDRRHGLEYGDTIIECERRAREQMVAKRLKRLEGATVGEIVNRALDGGC